MTEPIAQRTLVKSPPELWAEVSDVEALARHLGAFGEIRITRVVPETTVSWEGETARGTVELSAAGWGTKVTLRATATDQPEPADGAPAVAPVAAPSPGLHDDERILAPPSSDHWAASVEQKVRDRYVGAGPQPARAPVEAPVEIESVEAPVETGPVDDALPATEAVEDELAAESTVAETFAAPLPSSRPRGFMARLRWWFGTPADEVQVATPVDEPAPPAEQTPLPVAEATTPVAQATAQRDDDPAPVVLPFPGGRPNPAPAPEILPAAASATSDTPSLENHGLAPGAVPVDDGTIVGILTAVLDELGSAHHRPYSRG